MTQKKEKMTESSEEEIELVEELEINEGDTTIIECLKEFIKTCPYLEKYKKLFPIVTVDKLKEDVTSYMIMPVPCNPWINSYVDGTGKKQYVFNLSSRSFYSTDEKTNVKNNEFFEKFSNWLDDCTRNKVLPDMAGGKVPYKIVATTPGYLFNESETKAQYQIQCRLEYYQS